MRIAGERKQQLVLGRRQLDRPLADPHLARAHIDQHRAGAQHPPAAARGPGAAQQRADPSTQLRVTRTAS
jgi:hypothetical protein